MGGSVAEWFIPEHGILEFDYMCGQRPPTDAAPVDDHVFRSIMVTLQESRCKPSQQILCLRHISHEMYVKCVQVREMLGILCDNSARADLVVLFFLRLTDVYNEKLFRVRFEDPADVNKLWLRLGHMS